MSLTPRFAPTAPITNSGGFLSTAQRRLPPLRQQSHPQPHHHQQQQQQHQQHHQRRSHHPALSLNATKSGHSIGDGDRLNNSSSNNSNKHNHNHNNNNHNNSYNATNNGMASSRLGVSHHRNSGAPAYDNASPVSLTTGTSGAHRLSSSSAVGASGGLKGRRSSPRQRQQQQNHHYLQRTSMQKMAPQSNIGSDLAVQGHSPSALNDALTQRSEEPLRETESRVQGSPDLTPEVVSQYLRQNPDVLEQHVIHHVTSERIEKWLHKKAQQSASKNRDGTTNGEVPDRKRIALSRWRSQLQASKARVVQELSKDIHMTNGKLLVLAELVECVACAICADGHALFSCDSESQVLTHISRNDIGEIVFGATEPVGLGTSLAASVAFSKEPSRLKDLLGDRRVPDGLTVSTNRAQSAMGLPVADDTEICIGVVEFYRYAKYSQFSEEEEEVASVLLQWFDTLVDYVETHTSMIRQRTLSDFLLKVTKSIFQDIVSMDVVIMKIMNFAKALVYADRASLFLLDTRSHELYARIFDDGCSLDEHISGEIKSPEAKHSISGSGSEEDGDQDQENSDSDKEKDKLVVKRKTRSDWQQQDIRFSMNKGVAGYVASTGKILNIRDAYKDQRFNPEVDIRTGYKTQTILCMPIFIKGSVIGVVQMVNKLQGTFTKADEEAFEMFAIYCGLALHHAKLYEKIRRSEQKYKVALDVLSYHSQATPDEVDNLRRKSIPKTIPKITRYDFSPWSVSNDNKAMYVLYMFKQLFSNIKYDIDDLIRFTLTVRKNYRNVPYHNWAHAFSVAHSMFTVIQTAKHKLKPVESVSLFVACLCHDLDHRGKTNAFMVQSASPLAAIYTTSTMEHHHFNQTVTILQNEGHNIFKYLSSEEYKLVLSEIKQSILATDLAVFFKNKATLQGVLDTNGFSWDTMHHRNLLTAVLMTGCDLCAMFKPWPTQHELVYIIMEEFWQEGDEEKKRGITPMPMNDRDKQDELPNLEVGFIQSICVPCYELLHRVLPDTKPMLEGAQANLARWKKLADDLEEKKGTQV